MCFTFGYVKKNKKIIFQKLHTSNDLRKSAFANLWSNKIIWMDSKSNSKLCGDHFECPYITLEYFFDPFLSFLEKMFWISYCFLMMISRTQVLGHSLKAWFIHPMRTIWIKLQSNLALRNFFVTTKKFLQVKSSLFQTFNQSTMYWKWP